MSGTSNGLVPVMIRLKRPILWNSYVISLLLSKLSELNAKLIEMQASNFFIQVFGKPVNPDLVIVGPKIDLCKCLVAE